MATATGPPPLHNLSCNNPPAEGEFSTVSVSLKNAKFYETLNENYRDGEIVYRLDKSRTWVPYFAVLQSAGLKSIKREGWGLYALRHFDGKQMGQFGVSRAGEKLGEYTGEIVYETTEPNSTAAKTDIEKLVQKGNDRLMLVQKTEGGFEFIRGRTLREEAPLFRINDARDIPKCKNNVAITKNGSMRAITPVRHLAGNHLYNIPSLAELLPYELFVSYGPQYWRLQDKLGSWSLPILLDDV
tara:strand:+ start:2744 stop:3469 length:726 start_codon:yes stop_codon:yes gene_type:complete